MGPTFFTRAVQLLKQTHSTEYGQVDKPSSELALQFLKMTHFDQGSRVFTYVLMLDGQFRFTETGKEFGIDLVCSLLSFIEIWRVRKVYS